MLKWESENCMWRAFELDSGKIALYQLDKVSDTYVLKHTFAVISEVHANVLPKYVYSQMLKIVPKDHLPVPEVSAAPAATQPEEEIDPRLLKLKDVKFPADTGFGTETAFNVVGTTTGRLESENPNWSYVIDETKEKIKTCEQFEVYVRDQGCATVVGAYAESEYRPYIYAAYHVIFPSGRKGTYMCRDCEILTGKRWDQVVMLRGKKLLIEELDDKSMDYSTFLECRFGDAVLPALLTKLTDEAVTLVTEQYIERFCRKDSDNSYDGILKKKYVRELIRRLKSDAS